MPNSVRDVPWPSVFRQCEDWLQVSGCLLSRQAKRSHRGRHNTGSVVFGKLWVATATAAMAFYETSIETEKRVESMVLAPSMTLHG